MAIIKKASRQKVKIKLGYAGPAGSGKTMSSLLTAFGLCNKWEKILLIDTENGSGELYSNLGPYNVISLQSPFSPESYIDAINTAEDAGMEVIIIDSVSHEWDAKGGILETHTNMTGNSFTNWGKVTPRHNKFVEAILQSKCHVICTLRTKTDYVLVEKNGKQVPEKVGLKAITREGWEYDLTIVFDLDMKQQATTSKDRSDMFMNKPQFTPSAATGKLIKKWCDEGIADPAKPVESVKKVGKKTPATNGEAKPLISDSQFDQLIARVSASGGNDAGMALMNKAQEHFSFSDDQAKYIVTTIQKLPVTA